MSGLVIPAPAKVNLSLRILGRRDDGFHALETLICPIDLCDEIRWEPGEGGDEVVFECPGVDLGPVEENLALRAWRGMETLAGRPLGGRLTVVKRIPHGAGLGGGSSDAASVLRLVQHLASSAFDDREVGALAASLGSDVPVFLARAPAWCRGRGEIVEPAAKLPVADRRILLLKPVFGVATPQAYREWAGSREIPGVPYGPRRMPWGELVNDLERPVFARYPVLAEMKQWLLDRPGVEGALLSGSGSTVFALLADGVSGVGLGEDARARFGETLWVHESALLGAF